MRLIKAKRRFGCEINITPLIDIVFLLIIFSMVVSQFTKLQAEKLDLPEARSGAEPGRVRTGRVVVNILRDGQAIVAGRGQSPASLDRLLAAEARRVGAGEASVLIRSDRRTGWRWVWPILRTCARRGIARVKVAVAEGEAQPATP